MTNLLSDIVPVLSTPDFVVRPLIPVTLDLPLGTVLKSREILNYKKKHATIWHLAIFSENQRTLWSNLENRQSFD